MTHTQFEELIQERIRKIRGTLLKKGNEYSAETDRLSNFKRAAVALDTTAPKALLGFMVKHWLSVVDIVNGKPLNIDEKLGDLINYLILLEALLKE